MDLSTPEMTFLFPIVAVKVKLVHLLLIFQFLESILLIGHQRLPSSLRFFFIFFSTSHLVIVVSSPPPFLDHSCIVLLYIIYIFCLFCLFLFLLCVFYFLVHMCWLWILLSLFFLEIIILFSQLIFNDSIFLVVVFFSCPFY